MGRADNIDTIDSSTFGQLANRLVNSKSFKLIQNDAANDAHVIAERNRDRAKFLPKGNSDVFDTMKPSYGSDSSTGQQVQLNEDAMLDSAYDEKMKAFKEKYSVNENAATMGMLNAINGYKTNARVSRLPKEIQESFAKTNDEMIENQRLLEESYGLYQDMANSKKEEMGIPVSNQSKRNNVVEQTSSNVDYSLINKIINETVKKYAKLTKKQMLDEQKESDGSMLKAMKIGNKFSFITENGDVYEAKLVKKGNINKMKK